MTRILSKPSQPFDISAASFRGSAGDLGEVLALLAGGARPDPETLSRLCLSLRSLQAFLLAEAKQQAGREAMADDDMVRAVLAAGRVTLVAPYQPAIAEAAVHLARAHG